MGQKYKHNVGLLWLKKKREIKHRKLRLSLSHQSHLIPDAARGLIPVCASHSSVTNQYISAAFLLWKYEHTHIMRAAHWKSWNSPAWCRPGVSVCLCIRNQLRVKRKVFKLFQILLLFWRCWQQKRLLAQQWQIFTVNIQLVNMNQHHHFFF